MPVRARSSLVGDAALLQLEQDVEAVRARATPGGSAAPRRNRQASGCASSSRERSALPNAWPNVRPIAITSPTDFMWVESVGVDARELLEREPRPLDDHVVERRLEAGGRGAGDVVGDLVERVADGQARGDLGDREAGRLRRQRADERDTRGFISMTTISSVAGLTANWTLEPPVSTPDGADHGDRLVAQLLVGAVGQRLLRGDGHASRRCARPSGRCSRSSRRSRRCPRGRA